MSSDTAQCKRHLLVAYEHKRPSPVETVSPLRSPHNSSPLGRFEICHWGCRVWKFGEWNCTRVSSVSRNVRTDMIGHVLPWALGAGSPGCLAERPRGTFCALRVVVVAALSFITCRQWRVSTCMQLSSMICRGIKRGLLTWGALRRPCSACEAYFARGALVGCDMEVITGSLRFRVGVVDM